MKPMFFPLQLQNYAGNFVISASCSAVCFMWTFIFVREKPKPSLTSETALLEEPSSSSYRSTSPHTSSGSESNSKAIKDKSIETTPLLKKKKNVNISEESTGIWKTFKQIIDYQNLMDVYSASVKRRPGTTRLRMWLMILIINLTILPAFGRIAVIYPLVQKLYKWDSVMYSNLNTISGVVHIVAIILVIPVIFKLFKTNDCQTSMIGVLSGIIADVFIGSIVTPMGFYLHAVISSLSGVAGTGARAYLSKVLPKEDVSKIFAVTLMTEALLKAIASFLFTFLLQVTISFYATFVFHFMAIILLIALTILVYVDLTTPYPL